MTEQAAHATADPVIMQVVRSRLIAITDQMRLALQAVSGSPTVTEASDFFTGLYLPDGSFTTMGHQVTFEAPPVGALIRHLLASGYELKDGDRIIGNDPFIGALHQNDVQMCAPLLVDGGVLRQDVLDMILAATRLPAQVGLDIRAFIATLNVAADRLKELCARYGTDVVQAAMVTMVDDAETRMRARLMEIPDGTVHVRDFLEHDGHTDKLYVVDLVATKTGDRVVLDFSGSSGQAPGFVNCSRAGLMGGVAGAVIPTLGFGIPWNEGLLRPIEVTAPDRLVCTAMPPAPVGSATVETVWVVSNVVSGALNRLLMASPQYRHRAQGVSSGTMATFNLSGRNQYGEVFGLHLMDPLAGGFGAFASHDGQDAAGPINAPCPSIADVEVNEQKNPLFYLHRRLAPDTGGAGRRRGGMGAEVALTISIPQAEALVMTHGLEVPNSVGLSGGQPGGVIAQSLAKDFLAHAGDRPAVRPLDADYHRDFAPLGPKPGAFPMTSADVFAVTWQGGGGIGDPLDRDPDDVVADVRRGVVSRHAAETDYGVVLRADGRGAVNGWHRDETALRRREIRASRLGRDMDSVPATDLDFDPASAPANLAAGETWMPLGDRLRVIRGGDGVCRVETVDGAVLSVGHTRWREGAQRYAVALPAQVTATLHHDLAISGWLCPVSGAQLAIDVHLVDEEPFHDIELDLQGRIGEFLLEGAANV